MDKLNKMADEDPIPEVQANAKLVLKYRAIFYLFFFAGIVFMVIGAA